MKKQITFVFFFSLLLLSACQKQKTEWTAVSGDIVKNRQKSITFIQGSEEQIIDINAEGQFSGQIKNQQGYATLRYGQYNVLFYVESDKPLSINFDASTFLKSIAFDGESSTASNYLVEKLLLKQKQGAQLRTLVSKPENEFIEGLNADKAQMLQLLNSKEGLSKKFIKDETANVDYEFISLAKMYEGYHQYVNKKPNFKVSDSFNDQWADIDYDNESYFRSLPSYKNLVTEHYAEMGMPTVFDALKKSQSPYIQSTIARLLSETASFNNDDLAGSFNQMIALATVPSDKEAIEKQYNKIKGLAKGSPSPSFNYETVDGKSVSLEDLKGKNIYIDVWATWCGPCIAEVPALKKLEAKYHNDNIAFVSISVDEPKNKEKWKSMIKDKGLKGIQLITGNGWGTPFIGKYLITGIPRFILLDTDGNIVSADAPRPSSGQVLEEMIDGLL